MYFYLIRHIPSDTYMPIVSKGITWLNWWEDSSETINKRTPRLFTSKGAAARLLGNYVRGGLSVKVHTRYDFEGSPDIDVEFFLNKDLARNKADFEIVKMKLAIEVDPQKESLIEAILKHNNPSDLSGAFPWSGHRFGYAFWGNEHYRLKNGQPLTKKAKLELERMLKNVKA